MSHILRPDIWLSCFKLNLGKIDVCIAFYHGFPGRRVLGGGRQFCSAVGSLSEEGESQPASVGAWEEGGDERIWWGDGGRGGLNGEADGTSVGALLCRRVVRWQ